MSEYIRYRQHLTRSFKSCLNAQPILAPPMYNSWIIYRTDVFHWGFYQTSCKMSEHFIHNFYIIKLIDHYEIMQYESCHVTDVALNDNWDERWHKNRCLSYIWLHFKVWLFPLPITQATTCFKIILGYTCNTRNTLMKLK